MAEESYFNQYVVNPIQNAFTSLTKGEDLSGLPYDAQAAAIAKRQKLAELLMQQGQQQPEVLTYKGIAAQPSVAGGLGKALSQFMGAYMGGKAEEDAAKAKAKEDKAVGDIYTKIFSKTPDTQEAGYYLPQDTANQQKGMTPSMPSRSTSFMDQGDASNVGAYVPGKTTPGHYLNSEEQMAVLLPQMPAHPALKELGNTIMSNFMKQQAADIELKKQLAKFAPLIAGLPESQKATISNLADVDPGSALDVLKDVFKNQFKPAPSITPAEIANLKVRIKDIALRQGTDAAKAAFEGIGNIPGIDPDVFLREVLGGSAPAASLSPTTIGGVPGAVPNPAVGGTAPAGMPNRQIPAQPTAQTQPSGNTPGAMPRTAAPSQGSRPAAKPSAASAEVPLTDPRNPVYRGMAPKNVQENITKLNLERATAAPQVNGQLATLYNLRNTVDNLYTHPALGNILGVFDQFSQTDTKPETINARSLYDQLFSQTAISQLQAMRDASKTGGAVGQVTEAEWDKLSNAALAMNPKQSPEDFKRGLDNYKNTLNQIEDKLRGTYKSTYGGKIDFTPPKYTTYAQAHKPNALKTGGDGNSNKPAKIPTPQTIEEYNALPSGAAYFDTADNKTYRKP
jgi:hypothetical protein